MAGVRGCLLLIIAILLALVFSSCQSRPVVNLPNWVEPAKVAAEQQDAVLTNSSTTATETPLPTSTIAAAAGQPSLQGPSPEAMLGALATETLVVPAAATTGAAATAPPLPDQSATPTADPPADSQTSTPAQLPTSTIRSTATPDQLPTPTIQPTPDHPPSPTIELTSIQPPPPAIQPTSTMLSSVTQQPLPTGTTSPSAAEFSIIPSAPPVGASDPTVHITSLSIPTYNYEQAFVPTAPDDPIYPYPRLSFDQIGGPSLRSYQAVVLENGYTSLTILPELGGRIYRWIDKATGRHLLYENPVIKPTSWGFRGWWLAAGGIEWAFPVSDHGLVEYQPWNFSTGYGFVTVSTVDQRTGMEVGATISLEAGHAYMTIQPWARNNTESAQQYQLWLNAMVTLGGNSVSPQTQFIVPSDNVIIHSSSASGVPGSGGTMPWPSNGGRDMSWYGAWDGYLGFFASGISYSGLYDHAADQGIVRINSPGWPAGSKFFGPATLSPSLWTDDGSNYVELWSGATGSFWSDATLEPGENVGWTERWYPISNIGGFTYANGTAALRLVDTGGEAEIGAAVSGGLSGVISLYAGSQEAANWPVTLYPGQAFRATWSRPTGVDGALGLSFVDNQGNVLAQTGLVP